ncbi:anaphase-promoting complex, cyclosome, subunit 4-domain-containing protein [Apodospora peruviana]|uniref:Anaphase-promoting complex subunit 4 n=1 Tax=Apodospora peruviana TaxID=516989 RepID=A0AAE0LZB4_9PEZI|nr:anaphase-promoting complex, cyclosome, subunit 4-domain-containing protein [Apodospora peruviana]
MNNNNNAQQPQPQLRIFSASTLPAPVVSGRAQLLACNPVIDLTATVSSDTLSVWRPNEQLVGKHAERGQRVVALRWKEDGQFLAAGWSDGVVRLIGLESSKAMHHIRVSSGDGKSNEQIEFIAWSRNLTGDRRESKGSNSKKLDGTGIEVDDDGTEKSILDLPHELTFLEIETALPKLSPLPVSGGGSGNDMFIFSTTSSLDFVFPTPRPEDADTVHVMMLGTADGQIHLSIYDSFVIGMFQVPSFEGENMLQLCRHGSHPDLSTHSLVLRDKSGDGTKLYHVPMDLTFVHSSPVNLSLLASKTTTLQNLLRYLKQAQSHMASEWKSTRELPARFLAGVEEDLAKMEGGPVTVVQALYHTVATGHVFPAMKEWLVDSLAERGHKRWDKAVMSGLTNLRSLVHQNYIPALERCGIILSRLLGIARFHDSARESIGFTAAHISRLMEIVACLTVVSNNVLLGVMDELEHFRVFSGWLRMQIDQLASSASTADELTEREATMDHAKVLTYVQRYLVKSPLATYFDEITKEAEDKDLAGVEDAESLLDLLDRQLTRQAAGQSYMKALPHIEFLLGYLTNRANAVFRDIAEAEKRSVRFGQATGLSVGEKIWKFDVWVSSVSSTSPSYSDGQARTAHTYTAIVTENDKCQIYMFRTETPIVNGISGQTTTLVCRLDPPVDGAIVDFKFLDDRSLIVLCRQKGEPTPILLRANYKSHLINYSAYNDGERVDNNNLQNLDDKKQAEVWTSCGLSDLAGLVPVQMEVQRASKARGDVPARVCLLGRDRASYKTYALPEDWEALRGKRTTGQEDIAMELDQ